MPPLVHRRGDAAAAASVRPVPVLRGPWGAVLSLAWVVLAFAAEPPLRDAAAAMGLPARAGGGGLPQALDSLAAWGSILLVVVLAVRLTDVPLRDYLGWRRPRPGDLVLAAGFVLTLYGALVAITLLADTAAVHAGRPGRTAPGAGPVAVVLAWSSTVLLAPIVEESLFRGFLWRGIANRHGVAAALVLTSVVFAAFHWGYWMRGGGIDLLSVVHYLVMGGVLGAFRLASGSTLVPMVAHGLANASLAAFPTVVTALA
ncbi:CPBP family intramembrane metalloprotease [Rhodoplanes sp. TEM]|uniref:CPBP family intramembrane metalloprotease n=1 Tax=Rhodoplanes tepidamans TaxID=200616 RepID=A0ABT5JHQ3_RHOTP|nr:MULTISPECIES: CPBP family intramembrane glutamic endopeptidase [Rhodoplanes]MDC7788901.1 CPBP family intramembrane metalloprotease [Rhodoplanes tepidamans]MDC7985608.1 CPBP family intramembrane metalloprotease [Rhodoplanes sp. TEM]MDQ0358764.1 membrane protease YdiL (CAAX protease family) [Rhodoplanes tepidamans]